MKNFQIKFMSNGMSIEETENWLCALYENEGLELINAAITPHGTYFYFKLDARFRIMRQGY